MAPDELRKTGEQLYYVMQGVECPSDNQLFNFLAEQLDSHPRTISRWINGERGIPGPVKVAIECLLRRPRQA